MNSTDRKFAPTEPCAAPTPIVGATGDAGWPTWLPGCDEEWQGMIWAERKLAQAKSADRDAARFLAALKEEI